MRPQAVDSYEKLFIDIQNSKSSNDIIIACRHLQSLLDKKNDEKKNLRDTLAERFLNSNDPRELAEIIKTIYKIEIDNVEFTRNLLNQSTHSEFSKKCLWNFAVIMNHSISNDCKESTSAEVLSLMDRFAVIGYESDLHFLPIFIELLIESLKHDDLTFEFVEDSYCIVKFILLNLDVKIDRVESSLLDLLKVFLQWCVKKENQFLLSSLISKVLKMSWSDKRKYRILTSITAVDCNILCNDDQFNTYDLIRGLEFSLSFTHLLSPSQSLFANIQNHPRVQNTLVDSITHMLLHDKNEIAENVIKHRLSTSNETFLKLIGIKLDTKKQIPLSPTSVTFSRMVMIKTILKSNLNLPEMDYQVNNSICLPHDYQTKMVLLNYLIERAAHHGNSPVEKQFENIFVPLSFLKYNMCIENSGFVDSFVKKAPKFFASYESKKLKNVAMLKEVFDFMRDEIIGHGFQLGSYQSVTFSMKFLKAVLTQFFGKKNQDFGQFLVKNEIFDWNELANILKILDQEEFSDLGEISVGIIKDFYLKCDEEMSIISKWIQEKENESEEHDYFEITIFKKLENFRVLKYEIAKKTGNISNEMKMLMQEVKNSLLNLDHKLMDEISKSPKFYKKLSSINFLLKISELEIESKILEIASIFSKTVDVLLNYVNIPGTPLTFEKLDGKITELKINSGKNVSKENILNFIFYCLRSASEFTEVIIEKINQFKSIDVISKTIDICIEINVKIMSRCCHKGAIEASRLSIGKVTKYISQNAMKGSNCDVMQEKLKLIKKNILIECPKILDIRASRGLILMASEIISNHPYFVEDFMTSILKNDKFDLVETLQLHLIARIVKDSNLVQFMLKFYDKIIIATLNSFKETKDFVVLNALLQIMGSILPKISNQKRHRIDDEDETALKYEFKDGSVFELKTRYPNTFEFALNELNSEMKNPESMSETYLIMILEILSVFENSSQTNDINDELIVVFFHLMEHRCEKVRFMAAKCQSLWMPENAGLFSHYFREMLTGLFTTYDDNKITSTVQFIIQSVLRMQESSIVNKDCKDHWMRFIKKSCESFQIRTKFLYSRSFFLDLLLFFGFKHTDVLTEKLINTNEVDNLIGFSLWKEKLDKLK